MSLIRTANSFASSSIRLRRRKRPLACAHVRRPAPELGRSRIKRSEIIAALNERGIDFDQLAEQPGKPMPTRSTCFAILRSMRRFARAASGRSGSSPNARIISRNSLPKPRQVLDELLEKYAEHGDAQFVLPDVLKVPPISTTDSPPRS